MTTSYDNWEPYAYDPSIVAAIIFTVLFFLITTFATIQFIRALQYYDGEKVDRKRALIIIPFLVGGVFETVGCVARIFSSRDDTALTPFIVQSLLLLVAPALFAATIYMILGRIIAMLNSAHQSVIPLKWLTKIFVIGDIVSFLMQGSGAGIMTSGSESSLATGEKIIYGGLFVQIGFFAIFIIVAAIFQFRVSRHPSQEALSTRYSPSPRQNWQMILVVLFACSALILIRCVIRAIEYLQGQEGYIISHEIFLYTLDLLLMFLNMVLLCSQDICMYFVRVGPSTRQNELSELSTNESEKFARRYA